MIFKLNKKEYDKMAKQIIKDIGLEIRDELRDEVAHLRSYYDQNIVPSIVFDESLGLVGSEEWGAAAIDDGSDWHWSKFPNIDNLKEWVRYRKDDGAYSNSSDSEVSQIAYKVGKKIMKDGIEPTYYVKSVLGLFHRQVSLDY